MSRFDEVLKEIPPIYTAEPKDPIQQKNVAQLKRFAEYYLNDPDFRESYKKNKQAAIDKYRIQVDVKTADILLDPEFYSKYSENPEALPLEIKQFYAFFLEKVNWRNFIQNVACVPENPALKKWRQRQVNRCWGEFSTCNADFIHVPLVFELSLGCSVGCSFCALSSQPLKKVFKATPENISLWREVLEISKNIIGPAAGEGVCYCASEPLDNPDYEILAGIYREILGKTPQITTAVAMRNPERTKNILIDSLNGYPIIHRFSILNLETFRAVCDYFTAEELLYVELLPRYEGSLSTAIANAGRSRENGLAVNSENNLANTISCASGFIVNMAEKSIRLTTPCNADDEHPTGEIIIGKYYFDTAEDFKALMLKMITENMPLYLDMSKILAFQKFYRYEETDDGIILHGASKFTFNIKEQYTPRVYKEVGRMLTEGKYSGREIADSVSTATNADPAVIFNFLRYLDNAGALIY